MMAFWILAILVLVSALAVVALSNPLHSALCLATNLVAVAGIYAVLGAHFLAAVQVIVYAGAIMVLVVFVLMLLNLKKEDRNLSDLLMLGVSVVAAGFCASVALPLIKKEFAAKIVVIASDGSGTSGSTIEIGKRLFGEQAFLLQLTGLILITAIVGSIVLASQRKVPKVIGEK